MTATPEMNWELSDIITNAKNVRSAMITDKKGALVTQNIASKTEPLSTPFGASAFNDPTATRKNLCLRCPPSLEEKINRIDNYMRQYLVKHATRLFKGKQVNYKPLLVPGKDDYPPLLRCKINTAGHKACKVWNDDNERCDMPEDLRDYNLVGVRVHFRSLWLMGDSCGITTDIIDLRIVALENECPFDEE